MFVAETCHKSQKEKLVVQLCHRDSRSACSLGQEKKLLLSSRVHSKVNGKSLN